MWRGEIERVVLAQKTKTSIQSVEKSGVGFEK
jgi:hypothetical protein